MPEPLKNMYNETFINDLATSIHTVYAKFDSTQFTKTVFNSTWDALELKERMRHITHCLHNVLPDDYQAALAILREAADQTSLADYSFELMIFPDFVEVYGLDDWQASLPALEQFTQYSSAEFAVRPFIVQDSKQMMTQMTQWATHESHHVRRLASEGCRPRLPWAMALPDFKKDPAPILPILEMLKNDSSEYVRRSVANNLNDITKDNPNVVLEMLATWKDNATKETEWVINHALRSLVKAGDTDALAILGFGAAKVALQNFVIEPQSVQMGEAVHFSFDIVSESNSKQALIVDYAMHFVRANDKQSSKVFKLKKVDLAAQETVSISKEYSFKPISTRRYYTGTHAIEIQVNGTVLAKQSFELIADDN